MPSPAFKS
jgi:hypothetical protein